MGFENIRNNDGYFIERSYFNQDSQLVQSKKAGLHTRGKHVFR